MKISVFAFLLVIAGAYALPQQEVESPETRIVTNQIRRVIQQISQQIKEAGLDPLEIKDTAFEYKPMPNFVELEAFIESLTFTGASNIAINSLRLNILSSRVNFDISLPELRLSVLDSGFDVKVFGNNDTGRFNGSIIIKQVRLSGQVHYRLRIISGVNIRNVTLRFSIGGIESNVRLIAFGNDYTNDVNTLLNETIPATLKQYENDINKRLEEFAMEILKDL